MKIFLKEAKVAELSSLGSRRKMLEERCAALIWARQSLGHCADPPNAWACLPAQLQAELLTLYPIPPFKGTGPAPSDLALLADRIVIFSPVSSAALASPSALGGPGASSVAGLQVHPGGINTARPDGGQAAPSLVTSQTPPPPPALPVTISLLNSDAPAPAVQSSGPSAKRQRLMSYEELAQALPPVVFSVLDIYNHLEPDKKMKLQSAYKHGVRFDPCTGAPFAHQNSLSYSTGSAWDTTARAFALAAAGRSVRINAQAELDSAGEEDDAFLQESIIEIHRQRWAALSWGSPEELGATALEHCWQAVTAVMRRRASRSKKYGCLEVEESCQDQLRQVKAYKAEVSAAIAMVTAAYPPAEIGRARNKEHFRFFYPFWAEHILGRGRIDAVTLTSPVNAL